MKPLAIEIPIVLSGHHYSCDLILGLYADSARPALMLIDAEAGDDYGSAVAVVSLNPPVGYLTGFLANCFVWKDYSENEGVQAQLVDLKDADGRALFKPFKRNDQQAKITMGFEVCEIWQLEGQAALGFANELNDFHDSKCPRWKGVLDES
jgi:hypothetical protein